MFQAEVLKFSLQNGPLDKVNDKKLPFTRAQNVLDFNRAWVNIFYVAWMHAGKIFQEK